MEEAFDVYWAELVATGNLPTDVTELCKFKLIAAKFFTQSQQDEKARSEALDLEIQRLETLHKEHLEDEAYGKNEGRSMEIEICRQNRERKKKAVIKIQRAFRAYLEYAKQFCQDKAFEETVERIRETEARQRAVNAKIMQNFEDGWYECVEEFQREEVATQVSRGGLDTAQIYFNNLVKGLLKLKDPQAMREQLWIAREIQRVFNIRNGKPEDYPNPVINRVQIAMETMVAEEPKEEPKEESEPAVPHIPYAILNVFHNYYDEEMKHFLEEVDDEWSKEIFEREFENHMLYSLLVMRFGEEYARNEMKDMWDHHCKEGEYNSD
jgi:hypothetical protein